jgi:uncharacterized SAM-binding protein YcdF (DUF218 family)
MPGGLNFTRSRRWPRRLRRLAAALLLVVLVGVALALILVVLPETRAVPGDTDAVVVLPGGDGERLQAAQRVMPAGATEVLVVTNPQRAQWPDGESWCATTRDGYEVQCTPVGPPTTRGEAQVIAALADRRGWTELTLLTSTYDVARARMILQRCVDADIAAVSATPDLSPLAWVGVSVRELWELARDGLIQRGC